MRHVSHRLVAVAASVVAISSLVACAEMQKLEDQAKAAMAQSGSGPQAGAGTPNGAQAGTGAANGAPAIPGMPGAAAPAAATPSNGGGGSGGNSQTWCCVNNAFFDCGTADKALQCIGQPMQLMPCAQNCKDTDCNLKCIKDYGPDAQRAGCTRAAARDGECPK